MEQDDVIRRLRGLGKGTPPAAPDFTRATQPIPSIAPVASRAARMGVAPIAAAVAVLALATASLALPKGGPLRQVLAGDDTTETTEVLDEADAQEGAAAPDPCETMPVESDSDGDAGIETEAELAAREQRAQAWAEWRAENCAEPAPAGTAGDDDGAEDDGDDDSDSPEKDGRSEGRNNSARDEACTGPPPHANNPGNGDPDRTAAEREQAKRDWQEWHRENCTSGDSADGDDDDRDDARPDKGQSEGRGHEKANGQGHGPDDANHRQSDGRDDDRQKTGERGGEGDDD